MRLYRIACWLVITIFCSPHQALSEDNLYVGYGYCQSPPPYAPVLFRNRQAAITATSFVAQPSSAAVVYAV